MQVRTVHEVSGRKFSLLQIREDHLKRMSELNALRKLNIDQLNDQEVQTLLEDNGKFTRLLFLEQNKQTNRYVQICSSLPNFSLAN